MRGLNVNCRAQILGNKVIGMELAFIPLGLICLLLLKNTQDYVNILRVNSLSFSTHFPVWYVNICVCGHTPVDMGMWVGTSLSQCDRAVYTPVTVPNTVVLRFFLVSLYLFYDL